MTGRGALNPQIQQIAKARIGREISLTELHLMPYIDYCLKNDRRIDIRHINQADREIMSEWRKNGWLEGGASSNSLRVTRDFYFTIQEILWIGYVTYDGW